MSGTAKLDEDLGAQDLNSDDRIEIILSIVCVEEDALLDFRELQREDGAEEKWHIRAEIEGFSKSVLSDTGWLRWDERFERSVRARRESIPRS